MAVTEANVLLDQCLLGDLLTDVLGRRLVCCHHDDPRGALVKAVAGRGCRSVEVAPDVPDEVSLVALPMGRGASGPSRRLVHDHDAVVRAIHQHLRPGPCLAHTDAPTFPAECLSAHESLWVLVVHDGSHQRFPWISTEAHRKLPSAGHADVVGTLSAGWVSCRTVGPLTLDQPQQLAAAATLGSRHRSWQGRLAAAILSPWRVLGAAAPRLGPRRRLRRRPRGRAPPEQVEELAAAVLTTFCIERRGHLCCWRCVQLCSLRLIQGCKSLAVGLHSARQREPVGQVAATALSSAARAVGPQGKKRARHLLMTRCVEPLGRSPPSGGLCRGLRLPWVARSGGPAARPREVLVSFLRLLAKPRSWPPASRGLCHCVHCSWDARLEGPAAFTQEALISFLFSAPLHPPAGAGRQRATSRAPGGNREGPLPLRHVSASSPSPQEDRWCQPSRADRRGSCRGGLVASRPCCHVPLGAGVGAAAATCATANGGSLRPCPAARAHRPRRRGLARGCAVDGQ
mmetsp:Transcript_30831/g.85042  ORF Transcript_30831/g.85042 Transcript_30831/m.85042 type:complete len:514 (-) Transcript_30831:241-1782(-)